jgi:membrane-associated phospholipid phosphatase
MRRVARIAGLLALTGLPPVSFGGGGPFGIDYELGRSDRGIWSRSAQAGLEDGVIALDLAGALWLGNDHAVGHTFWQSADSLAVTAVSVQVLKLAFSRARPTQGDNPNAWFQGHGHESFPSGEVAEQAAFVTPFVVDYGRTHPWVWALEALPVYDAVGRLKSQAHWQSDVIVAGLIGTGIGYWSTTRRTPLFVQILPRGVSVGLYKRF